MCDGDNVYGQNNLALLEVTCWR